MGKLGSSGESERQRARMKLRKCIWTSTEPGWRGQRKGQEEGQRGCQKKPHAAKGSKPAETWTLTLSEAQSRTVT